MRRLLLAAVAACLVPTVANATTWVAVCNDGQHVQYNHTAGGPGLLYFSIAPKGGIQMARLTETVSNKSRVCGAVTGNSAPGLMPPLTQLCINFVPKTISILWHDPIHPATPVVDMGVFCTATVTPH